MTTNHDALREAQEEPFEKWWEEQGQYGRTGGVEYEKTFAWNAWCAALSQPMPEAPNPSADDIHSCSPFCTRPGCVADREANKPEPQAHAGEPDYKNTARHWHEVADRQAKAIAKKDAVLQACVAHMLIAYGQNSHDMILTGDELRGLHAAITQAQEALK